MSMQETLQQNRTAVIIGTVIVIGLAWVFIGRNLLGGRPQSYQGARYYLDLGTGELFSNNSVEPPITAPSGQSGVMARVYSCGSCEDAGQRFIAYLQQYSEDARAALKQPPERRTPFAVQEGTMVSAYKEGSSPQWVSLASPAGVQIQDTPLSRCETARECFPQ